MEEQEDYGFIYITENLINGKQYIGQKKFGRGHKYYLGSGTLLQKAIKKHGRENFTRNIIEVCSSKEELDEKEIFWIAHYNALEDENFYNLCIGGSTTTGHKVSEETRKKMSKSSKGKFPNEETRKKMSESRKKWTMSEEDIKRRSNSNRGHIVSEETRKKIGDANRGTVMSEETKQKLREINLGKIVSDETRRKLAETSRNRVVKDETREKIRKLKTGTHHSEESRKKMSESNTGKNKQPVLKFDKEGNFIEEYDSIIGAIRGLGKEKRAGGISDCCAGRKKSAYGYIWKFKEI